jgi:hypothetical protein
VARLAVSSDPEWESQEEAGMHEIDTVYLLVLGQEDGFAKVDAKVKLGGNETHEFSFLLAMPR